MYIVKHFILVICRLYTCVFCELTFICEINFQQRLFHRYMYVIHMYCCISYIPYTKWCRTSTSRKLPVHSQIQMILSRVVCRQKPFLQSAKREMQGLVHARHRAEQQDHKYNLQAIRQFLCNNKHFFLHRESILIQALGFHVLDEVDTFNHEGVSAMPCIPAPTFSNRSHENAFAKLNFANDLRNIIPVKYKRFTVLH